MKHPLTRIADQIKAFYKEHQRAWLFIFCVILSAGFWTFNTLNKKFVHTIQIPLSESEGNDTLLVTLEGKGFDLFSLLAGDSLPVVAVNPSSYFGSLSDTVPAQLASEKLIDMARLRKHEVKLVSVSPPLVFPARAVVSARKVPVKLNLKRSGNLSPALLPGPMIVKPDSVTIYGPYARISLIEEVITDSMDHPGSPGVHFTGTNLINPDPGIVKISSEYAWMYCNVEELTEGQFLLPVSAVGYSFRKLSVIPDHVTLTFQAPASVIRNIRQEDFLLTIDPDQSNGTAAPVIIEKAPANLRHIRVLPDMVEFLSVEEL